MGFLLFGTYGCTANQMMTYVVKVSVFTLTH